MTERTNERNCLLAPHCRHAANPTHCHTLCDPFIAFGRRLQSASVPSDYVGVTLANAPCRKDQAEAYRLLTDYIATFERQFTDDERVIKSVYLWSVPPGTGKTTTASAVLHAWLVAHYVGAKKRGIQPLARPAYFLDVNAWQTDYNAFNRPRVPEAQAEAASQRYYAAMKLATDAPFAVLDDIGVRDATDGFRGDLHAVINTRVTERKPTVYTSNVALERLEDVFDARLADRIRHQCVAIHFAGESRRGLRK